MDGPLLKTKQTIIFVVLVFFNEGLGFCLKSNVRRHFVMLDSIAKRLLTYEVK
jgi:hypothetical protein